MKLSEAVKGPRPEPKPTEPHGVRQVVAFRSDGAYRRDEVRQIAKQLRDGIPDASATTDELGIGLCGLLEGGRYAHCEADRCYPSVQAMRVKAFSIGHGGQAPQDNPFPPGSLSVMNFPNEEFDGEQTEARIRFALQAAEAARAQYEQDPARIAAEREAAEYRQQEALRALTDAIKSQDAAQAAALEREQAELRAQVAAIQQARQQG